MKQPVKIVFLAMLALLALAVLVEAQRRRNFSGFDDFGRAFGFIDQNEPPDTEFVFARLRYGVGRPRFGGGGWAHDYPAAEQHVLQVMSEATGVNVQRMSYSIVEIGSPDLFKYPFSYISEPGEMWLTDEEVANFRQYVDRGGFVMIDDFDGAYDLENLRRNLERVFPDRHMFVLPPDHEIFHTYYDINSTDARAPYAYGGDPVFYGFPGKDGRTSMIICHNNDVGDFWEHIDQPRFPLAPSSESLRLGINFVLYAMTH